MYFAGGVLKKDIRTVSPCSQNEIRVLDIIFPAISGSDDERLERCRAQQFANALFHVSILCGYSVQFATGLREGKCRRAAKRLFPCVGRCWYILNAVRGASFNRK